MARTGGLMDVSVTLVAAVPCPELGQVVEGFLSALTLICEQRRGQDI